MNPELLTFNIPDFLQVYIKLKTITIYTYPVLISIGSLFAYLYLKTNKGNVKNLITLKLTTYIFISAFVGGKIFLFFENLSLFYNNPYLILKSIFTSGFVFYGSFIFVFIFLFYFLKRKKENLYEVLDIVSIGFLIIHFFGRIGCFFAGCCYGEKTNSSFGVVFKITKVHPTQLYEATILLLILIILLIDKKRKKFNGQLFFKYIGFYALGRFFIENYRGDVRGNFLNGLISHSQTIAIFLMLIATIKYFFLKYNSSLKYK